ncbi:hypothetical protein B296_00040646, partial [Ensete ventricosum]
GDRALEDGPGKGSTSGRDTEGGCRRLQEVSRLRNGACPDGAGVAVVEKRCSCQSRMGTRHEIEFKFLHERVEGRNG